MKKRTHVAGVLAVAHLAACATGYHGMGFTGGLSETQVESNVWVVTFNGNAYTTNERASDFVLLRSAELALQSGFRYFILVDNKKLNSSEETKIGKETYTLEKPGRSSRIVCFVERPNVKGMVYDARVTWNSIAPKYDVQQNLPSGVLAEEKTALVDVAMPKANCQKDTECKGDLICQGGQCVSPAQAVQWR